MSEQQFIDLSFPTKKKLLEQIEHKKKETIKQQTNTLLQMIKTKIDSVVEDICNFKMSYDEYTTKYIENRSYIYISEFEMRFIHKYVINDVFGVLRTYEYQIEAYGDVNTLYKISFNDIIQSKILECDNLLC